MTPHFTVKEMECHCGCGLLPSMVVPVALERVREKLGVPIFCSCAARCIKHNRSIGSRDRSIHPMLLAADIYRVGRRDARASPVDAQWIAALFRSNGWYALTEADHVHVDMRTWFPEILKLREEHLWTP